MFKTKRAHLKVLNNTSLADVDRRVFCRFSVSDIPFKFKELRFGLKGDGVCKDIGAGGAGVVMDQEVRQKTTVELWLGIPGLFEPVHLLGRIVWVGASDLNWRAGIVFDPPKFMKLSRMLKMQLEDHGDI